MGTGGMGKLTDSDKEVPELGRSAEQALPSAGAGTAPSQLSTEPGRGPKEDWIGRQLRRVFDDALHEPLPDDIMSLLDRLDEADEPDAPKKSGDAA